MRRIIVYLSFLFMVIFISCKDELEPFGETNEKYVMNCIVHSDTSYQVLTLTRSYSATSFDPYSNTDDHAIKGALIRLWEGNDKVSFFTDTTITRDASSAYKTPFTIYHTRGVQPAAGTVLDIEAVLPSGKKLISAGITPLKPVFTKMGYDGGEGDTLVPPVGKDYVRFVWGTKVAPKGTVYLPRVYIVYKILQNGQEIRKTKLVPSGYFVYKGVEYPEYPGLSNYPWFGVDMSTISRCMKELSEGDPDKEKYQIYSLAIDVLALDDNLSAYYSATNKNKDPFAVKLYETDYTNISGGFGVFGISFKASSIIDISAPYVRTFGYEHAYKKN